MQNARLYITRRIDQIEKENILATIKATNTTFINYFINILYSY